MTLEGNYFCVCTHLVPFLFFVFNMPSNLLLVFTIALLTGDSRSKGYGEHKQQVRWYIEYKKKERDQMRTNAIVGYPPDSFSLYSFTANPTSSPTDINDYEIHSCFSSKHNSRKDIIHACTTL